MYRAPYPSQPRRQLNDHELKLWQASLAEASRNNILCHCKTCDEEWVSSVAADRCQCGGTRIEHIACWQFPDG